MKTALLVFNLRDANYLLRQKLKTTNCDIITFDPTSYVALARAGITAIKSSSLYTNYYQAKTVSHVKFGLDEVRSCLEKNGIEGLAVDTCIYVFFFLISSACQLHYTTIKYDNLMWFNKGKLVKKPMNYARIELFKKLNSRTLETIETGSLNSVFVRMLIRYHNNSLANLINSKDKILVIDGYRKDSERLYKKLSDNRELYCILPKEINGKFIKQVRSVLSSIKFNKQSSGIKNVFFYYNNNNFNLKFSLADFAKNSVRKQLFAVYEKHLVGIIVSQIGYGKSVEPIFTKFCPSLVITDNLTSSLQKKLTSLARINNIDVLMFNHASHSVQSSPLSKQISDLWASCGRIDSEQANKLIVKSPSVKKLIEELSGQVTKEIIPYRFCERLEPVQDKKDFVFLYVGNYLDIRKHVPWAVETPDEYADAIVEFAKVISVIPNAKLIIRLKSGKKECDKNALSYLLGEIENVEVRDSGSFLEDLKQCDAIVTSFSNTVDEALSSGKVLILHTSNKRYQHFAGMTDIPTEHNRSPVYCTSKSIDIVKQIVGIIHSHQKPLTTEELKSYIWGSEGINLDQIAKKIESIYG